MADKYDGSIVINTKLDSDGFSHDSKKLLNAIEGLSKEITQLGKNLTASFSDLNKTLAETSTQAVKTTSDVGNGASKAASQVAKYDEEIAKLQKDIDKAEHSLEGYDEELEEIRQSTDKLMVDAATDKQAQNALKMEEQEIDRLNEKYAAQREKLAELSQEYENLSAKRAEAIAAAEAERTSGEKETGNSEPGREEEEEEEDWEEDEDGIDKSAFVLKALREEMTRVKNTAISMVKWAGRVSLNALATGARKASNAVKSLASSLSRAGERLKDFAMNTVKKFTAKMTTSTKSTNALVKSLLSLKSLLIARIKRMFISSIFNDVNEGLQKLAKFDSEFNAHMSAIKNNATKLTGSLSVALGNFISTVEPLVTKIITTLTSAVDSFNQFFAVLQGKSTYTAAIMGAEDYAASAEDAKDAQKEWNAELYSFDELNRQSGNKDSDTDTAGIQYEAKEVDLPEGVDSWIEKLKKAWEEGDWYEIGLVIGEGLSKAMEKVDEWITDTFKPAIAKWGENIGKLLNGLVDGTDWDLMGKTVADGMNAIVDGVKAFLSTFDSYNLGEAVGAAINSLVDNIDWKSLGDTVALGLNSIVDGLNAFLANFNAQNLGRAIASAINSLISGIDWIALGNLIANGLNEIVLAVRGFLKDFDARDFGGNLARSLNTAISGIKWKALARTLGKGLNTLFEAVDEFLKEFDALKLGKDLGKFIKTWFETVDWEMVGRVFVGKWNELMDILVGIVTTPGIWEKMGESVGQFVYSWFHNLNVDNVATFFVSFFNGVTAWIKSFLDQNPFEGVPEKISSAINRFFQEVDWIALGTEVSNLFLEVLGKIRETVDLIDWHAIGVAIGEFLGSIDWWQVFQDVADIVWKAFDGVVGGLLDTNGGKMFLALSAGLLGLRLAFATTKGLFRAAAMNWAVQGINPIGTIAGKIGECVPPIAAALGKIVSTVAYYGTLLAGVVAAAYSAKNIWDAVHAYNEAGEAYRNEIETALNSYQKLYEEKGPEIAAEWAQMCYQIDLDGKSMEEGQKAIVEEIEKRWEGAPKDWKEGFAAGWNHYFGKDGAGFIQLVKDGIAGLWNWITGFFKVGSPSKLFEGLGEDLITGLRNGVVETWKQITQFFTDAFDNLIKGFSKTWENIKSDAVRLWKDIKEDINQKWEDIKSAAKETWENIENKISTAWANIKDKVTSTLTGIRDFVVNKWNDMLTEAVTYWYTIKEEIWKKWDEIKSDAETAWTNIKNDIVAKWEGLKAEATTAFQNIKTAIDQKWTEIKDFVETSWNNLKTALKNISWAEVGNKLVTSIKEGVENLWYTLKSGVEGLWTGLRSYICTFSWEDVGRNVVSTIKTGVDSVWNTMTTFFGNLWSTLKQNIINIFNLEDVGRNLIEGFKNGISSAVNGAVTTATNFATGVADAVTGFFAIGSPSKLFEQYGEWLDEGLILGIEGGAAEACATVAEFAEAIVGEFGMWGVVESETGSTMDSIAGNVSMSLDNMAEDISSSFTSYQQDTSNTLNTIDQNLTSALGSYQQDTSGALSSVQSAVQNGLQSMSSFIQNSLNSIHSFLMSISWADAGRNMVSSLESGIMSAWGSLQATVQSMANSLLSSTKSVLQVSSPSKEAEKIGRYFDQGLAEGILGDASDIFSSISDLAMEAAEEFTGGIQEAKISLEDLIDTSLPAGSKVTPWDSSTTVKSYDVGPPTDFGNLDGIAEQWQEATEKVETASTEATRTTADTSKKANETVAETMARVSSSLQSDLVAATRTVSTALSSLGGLTVPQIASGTVIPYSAKVEASGGGSSAYSGSGGGGSYDSGEGNTYLSGIYSELSTLSSFLVSKLENAKQEIKIIMDGREVFNVVVAENDRHIQRTGSSPIRT